MEISQNFVAFSEYMNFNKVALEFWYGYHYTSIIYVCENMKNSGNYTGIKIQFWLWKGFENIILTIDCKFKTIFDAHLQKIKCDS